MDSALLWSGSIAQQEGCSVDASPSGDDFVTRLCRSWKCAHDPNAKTQCLACLVRCSAETRTRCEFPPTLALLGDESRIGPGVTSIRLCKDGDHPRRGGANRCAEGDGRFAVRNGDGRRYGGEGRRAGGGDRDSRVTIRGSVHFQIDGYGTARLNAWRS